MNIKKQFIPYWMYYFLFIISSAGCGRLDQTSYQNIGTASAHTISPLANNETAVIQPTHFAHAEQTSTALQTLQAAREQVADTSASTHNRTSVPLPTEGPTRVPSNAQPLQKSGYLFDSPGRFNRIFFIQNSWSFDISDELQIKVFAGEEDITSDPNTGRWVQLPNPHQGILIIRTLTAPAQIELFPTRKETRIKLPSRDGAAKILDARVEGERMLLTVKSLGGSVYVFDVSQGSFSAPQPPSVSTDGPYTLDPSAPLWMHAQGYDPAGVLLDYAWDLDSDGAFETAGQAAPLRLQTLNGQSSHTVAVRVTSKSGLSATAQTVVRLEAAAPAATP